MLVIWLDSKILVWPLTTDFLSINVYIFMLMGSWIVLVALCIILVVTPWNILLSEIISYNPMFICSSLHLLGHCSSFSLLNSFFLLFFAIPVPVYEIWNLPDIWLVVWVNGSGTTISGITCSLIYTRNSIFTLLFSPVRSWIRSTLWCT